MVTVLVFGLTLRDAVGETEFELEVFGADHGQETHRIEPGPHGSVAAVSVKPRSDDCRK